MKMNDMNTRKLLIKNGADANTVSFSIPYWMVLDSVVLTLIGS